MQQQNRIAKNLFLKTAVPYVPTEPATPPKSARRIVNSSGLPDVDDSRIKNPFLCFVAQSNDDEFRMTKSVIQANGKRIRGLRIAPGYLHGMPAVFLDI